AGDLSVVVLAGQTGGLDAPRQARANALDLVGRDLLAVARAADDDAQAALVSGDPPGGLDAVRRVVVGRVELRRPDVGHLVPLLAQVLHEMVLQFETRVVGGKVNTHGGESASP